MCSVCAYLASVCLVCLPCLSALFVCLVSLASFCPPNVQRRLAEYCALTPRSVRTIVCIPSSSFSSSEVTEDTFLRQIAARPGSRLAFVGDDTWMVSKRSKSENQKEEREKGVVGRDVCLVCRANGMACGKAVLG